MAMKRTQLTLLKPSTSNVDSLQGRTPLSDELVQCTVITRSDNSQLICISLGSNQTDRMSVAP
jgi:hypothetical protein